MVWKTPTKEVNADALRDTLTTLGSLAIVGVRPKQPGLTAELKIDREKIRSGAQLQNDLLKRGFLLQPSQNDQEVLELLAREGEIAVGTENGLVYKLYFGRAFTGSESELEIGLEEVPEDDSEANKEGNEKDESEEADTEKEVDETDKKEADPNKKPGRYIFVRVLVDPTLAGIGDEPVKPEKSAELIAAEEAAAKEAEAEKDSETEDEATEDKADEGRIIRRQRFRRRTRCGN